ncbi:hypothetical protein ACFSB1_11190 [Halopseudomonas phragmitis]|uniref:Uncharacterized protein n=1 Tax=Halopseudomonas phragmitis TaxID=1931241 RepID=A0A1V0B9L9_9GAMM|nr:hypothetical protein [Halopseudomonas phragmitis]AQZ96643.1 hypothetical protein BVH74_18630 [Halopseudomonas phragmitis]
MAVYRVEKGEWTKVAVDLAELIEWPDGADMDAVLNGEEFYRWDGVSNVYDVYQRISPATDGPFAGVRYLFTLLGEGDLAEDILVGEWLPDYLHVLERLEVLQRRDAALRASMDHL